MSTLDQIHENMLIIDENIRQIKLGNPVEMQTLYQLIDLTIQLANSLDSEIDYKDHILTLLNNYKNYI